MTLIGCGGGTGEESGSGSGTNPASLYGNNSVTVAWDSPTSTVNQSCAANLSGYTVYAGRATGAYALHFAVPVNAASCAATGQSNTCGQIMSCSYTIQGLASGLWHFAVTAYDSDGVESGYSDNLSHTL